MLGDGPFESAIRLMFAIGKKTEKMRAKHRTQSELRLDGQTGPGVPKVSRQGRNEFSPLAHMFSSRLEPEGH